jgi:pyrimidine operon attenuation protein/uracil phosphoribosyltransferase
MGGFVRSVTKVAKKVASKSPTMKLAKMVLGGGEKQGIELAKSLDNKVGEIQKTAANVIKGPTTLETLADTKRRGRKATMLTSAKGIQDDYKLSKKSILG